MPRCDDYTKESQRVEPGLCGAGFLLQMMPEIKFKENKKRK